jgi:serine O-acetyltransferase
MFSAVSFIHLQTKIHRRNRYVHRSSLIDDSLIVYDHNDFQSQERKERIILDLLAHKETIPQKIWEILRTEAKDMSTEDSRTSSLMASTLLIDNSFEQSLIDYLSNELQTPSIPATSVRNIFNEVVAYNSSISKAWILDLLATSIQDDSLPNLVSVFLCNKGYHALAAYRLCNSLWYKGQDNLARYFQSMISRVFGSDIHPACKIGPGCAISKASDVIIGETASVGRDCTFMQGVTLGKLR